MKNVIFNRIVVIVIMFITLIISGISAYFGFVEHSKMLIVVSIVYLFIFFNRLWYIVPGDDEIIGVKLFKKMEMNKIVINRIGCTYSFSLNDNKEVFVCKNKIIIEYGELKNINKLELKLSRILEGSIFEYCESNNNEEKNIRKVKNDLLNI